MRGQSVASADSGAGVAGGDLRLQRIGPRRPQCLGRGKRREPATDGGLVPASAILVGKQDRLAVPPRAGAQPRGLDLHQRDETVHLRLGRCQTGEDAAEAQRFLAQLRPHPVVAGRRRIAFVEDQVDDLQHRGEARRQFLAARRLEADIGLGQRALGAHDALGHGRLADQEGARDFIGSEPAKQAQRERHPSFRRQHGMAGGEDQTQQVVADVVVERGVEVGRRVPFGVHFAAELGVLALGELQSAQAVDRPVLRGRHQPGAGIVRHASGRPAFERHHQRILRQFLGEADVAHHARQPGDEPGRFDPPDGIDGAVDIGGHDGRR